VTVNGIGLDEPYVYRDMGDEPNKKFGPVTISKGNLWVMGDHRDNSEDSRVGGQVPQSKVVGQAFVRVWPLTKWRGFGVPKTFSSLSSSGPDGIGMLVPIYLWRRRSRKDGKKLPVFPVLDAYRNPPAD
jgi:signal peptidase I